MLSSHVEHASSDDEGAAASGSLEDRETADLGPPRILVVDDQIHVCKLLELQLKSSYDVVVATGVEQALSLAEHQSFAAALIDLDLGEERSGIDLLQALRAMPQHEALPAIACTAHTLTDSRERSVAAGFNGYIGKPFRKEQVLAAFRDVLDPLAGPNVLRKLQFKLHLPPLQATFPEVAQLLSRKENVPDSDRLVEILRKDPIVSTWVIRHVNSAYFSLVHKVSNIQRAVLMLGFEPVCNLVLAEAVARTFSALDSPKASRIYRHIMKISVGTAAFARLLGHRLGLHRADTAFTAGLLHQIGRLVLLSSDSRRYSDLWQEHEAEAGQGAGLSIAPDAELDTYGTDYARLGADIGREWQLPEELLVAIRYHTDPKWLPYKRYRILTLLVAAGHEAASEMYELPSVWQQMQARTLRKTTSLAELAHLLRAKPDKLSAHLRDKQEDVRAFVDGIVSH